MPDWLDRHHAALRDPQTPREMAMTGLLHTLQYLVAEFKDDGEADLPTVAICQAVKELLSLAEWGPRLDMGTLSDVLDQWIRDCGFDPDTGREL